MLSSKKIVIIAITLSLVLLVSLLVLFRGMLFKGRNDTPVAGTITGKITSSTAVQRLGLVPPQGTLSASDEKKYLNMITANAQLGSTVDIGAACEVSPVVLGVKKQQRVTFSNNDTKEHVIHLPASRILYLKSRESRDITINFAVNFGAYPYQCDTVLAGYFLVTE